MIWVDEGGRPRQNLDLVSLEEGSNGLLMARNRLVARAAQVLNGERAKMGGVDAELDRTSAIRQLEGRMSQCLAR